ncbi:MAG: glycerate kinase [Candidatus Thorarchaeota archaeon]
MNMRYFKNTSQLLSPDLDEIQLSLRKLGLETLEKAIAAVKPENLIKKSVQLMGQILNIDNTEYDLKKYNRIHIIGGGKASAEMAFTLETMFSRLKGLEYDGIINVPQGTVKPEMEKMSKLTFNYASHPIPDEHGLNGTKQMIEIIEKSNMNDLILCLISGGGSALLPLPKFGISLEDLKLVNSLLLACGASIHEINTIRKHISDFKGGNLARKLYDSSRARMISVIISDVVGNNLDSIASGPTVGDTTTFNDAKEILRKYDLLKKIPSSVENIIEAGLIGNMLETPKPGNECFKNIDNYLIGSVKSAVEKISQFLKSQGYEINYFSDKITGEAEKFGISLYNIISTEIDKAFKKNSINQLVLIGTGELTVTIKGKGLGGRNQEMLLSFLNHLVDQDFSYDFLVTSVNFDGIEGNSGAMGALVDNFVLTKTRQKKIDLKSILMVNDSNTFFKNNECELITGPTGCNVNDLVLVIIQNKNY